MNTNLKRIILSAFLISQLIVIVHAQQDRPRDTVQDRQRQQEQQQRDILQQRDQVYIRERTSNSIQLREQLRSTDTQIQDQMRSTPVKTSDQDNAGK